jgi:protein-tyrosine phosphatase
MKVNMATDFAKLLEKYDLIDFHSHILPGVDHGSTSLETTLFQLRSAKSAGVNKIISTSHFYPNAHDVKRFVEKREKAFSRILSCGEEIPEIRLGAEVLICNGIENLPDIEKLFIRGTNTILIELPGVPVLDSSLYTSIERILSRGVGVIIAHADRYRPYIIDRMISLGAKIQLNSSAIAGVFGPKKHILSWIDNKHVIGIGTDIHGADRKAYPSFLKAVNKLGGRYDHINKESNLMWNVSF